MLKDNIKERAGNCYNEEIADWYKEKVKILAEAILKRLKPADYPAEHSVNSEAVKEVAVK